MVKMYLDIILNWLKNWQLI